MKYRVALAALALSCIAQAQALDPFTEVRYCGVPARAADGSIKRSAAVLAAFRRANPCPSTGKTTGACPRWAVDHAKPLACGGCDAVFNMLWMRNDAKALQDSYERKTTPPVPGISPQACALQVMP
jgi:hypothetical protein